MAEGYSMKALQSTENCSKPTGAEVMHQNVRVVEPSLEIHPDDHMWRTGQDWYFSVGESGLRVIELALRMSLLPEVTSILDLPCGHGRVGRFLRAAFPKAKMYFCDLDRSGVDF